MSATKAIPERDVVLLTAFLDFLEAECGVTQVPTATGPLLAQFNRSEYYAEVAR